MVLSLSNNAKKATETETSSRFPDWYDYGRRDGVAPEIVTESEDEIMTDLVWAANQRMQWKK